MCIFLMHCCLVTQVVLNGFMIYLYIIYYLFTLAFFFYVFYGNVSV